MGIHELTLLTQSAGTKAPTWLVVTIFVACGAVILFSWAVRIYLSRRKARNRGR